MWWDWRLGLLEWASWLGAGVAALDAAEDWAGHDHSSNK